MTVELDFRILVLFCALAALVQGGLSLLFSSFHANTHALRPIGFSTITLAAALVAMTLQGELPDLLTVVVAHGLAGVTMLLLDRGVRVFQREPTWDPLGCSVVLATPLGLAGLVAVSDDLRPRILLLSVSGLILLARIAVRLHRGAGKGGSPAHRITECIFWIFVVMMLLRIGAVIRSPPHSAQDSPNLIQMVSLPIALLLLSAATLGFWSMEVQRLHAELMKLATTDEMTGVMNRRAFLEQCEREYEASRKTGTPLSLVMVDLDHFKRVNDTFGHPAEDEVLKQAVRTLEQAISVGGVVGRFGGEEFALLLPATGAEQAAVVAERARIAMAATAFPVTDYRIPVTCSAGVASLSVHAADLADLVHAADAALYAAKAAGRNCIRVAGRDLPYLAELTALESRPTLSR